MSQENFNPQTTFGFVTVIEVPKLGHCGGLLVVSHIGRPIEFHCTTPVGPNRAQEIMYGKTYHGFLYSDQIGMALVDKTRNKPGVYVTDCGDLLPISELIDEPVILVENKDAAEPFDGRGLKSFDVQSQKIYCVNAREEQLDWISTCTEAFARTLPLDVPFERIRQAIEEAHSVVRAA